MEITRDFIPAIMAQIEELVKRHIANIDEADNDRIARFLFDTMEKVEPTEACLVGWESLTNHERDFYRICVKELIFFYNSPTTA